MSAEGGAATVRIVVDAAEAGQRLDQLLAASGAVVSRARAQALLREGRVRVGGVPRKASYVMRVGDVVDATVGPGTAASDHGMLPRPEALPLDVLYEDAELIAINKAAGVVVHPAPGNWDGTLVSGLLHYLGATPAGGDPARPGIIHRLDKDTSGVLLVAKTATAHERVAAQFRERTVTKQYLAVARGKMRAREGVIDRPIGRHPRARQRMSVRTRRGRASATRYVVVRCHKNATVLRLFPMTGRTHQIRVHLAAIGHPIVGDRLYGRSRGQHRQARDSVLDVVGRFGRQALHAEMLGFYHPRTGGWIEIKAPLPADLRELLVALGTDDETGG